MSDLVFLRAWTQVEVPRFFNPLATALQPRDQTWQGMKTVAELRRENNLPVPVNKDSLYKVKFMMLFLQDMTLFKIFPLGHRFSIDLFLLAYCLVYHHQPIERKLRKFNPLVIPKSLQAALPFASKPKDIPKRKRPLLENRRAVVMEPQERKVHALVQHLQQIRNDKVTVV